MPHHQPLGPDFVRHTSLVRSSGAAHDGDGMNGGDVQDGECGVTDTGYLAFSDGDESEPSSEGDRFCAFDRVLKFNGEKRNGSSSSDNASWGWTGGESENESYSSCDSNSDEREYFSSSEYYSSGSDDDADGTPRLWNLHRGLGGNFVEGGKQNIRLNTKAANSDYYPFSNLPQQGLFWLIQKFKLSRTVVEGSLTMIFLTDGEAYFKASDLAGVDARHFFERMRNFLPLLEVIEREVPRSARKLDS